MKRALRKDFLMEIRHSMNRFLSILFIVALGVAFFAGIRSTRPDMELSADIYYDETNLMDIRIVGTLGLTEADLEAVRGMAEIADAEGAYTADVLCQGEDREEVVRIFSTTDRINQFTLTEGRLPQKAGECLMDRGKGYSGQFALGETVKVYSGSDDLLSDTLHTEEFTIVGLGMSSRFLSLERGTTTVGNGSLDTFMAVTPDNFSLDVYTDIYAVTERGRDMLSYSDEYQDYIDTVTKAIEDQLSDERCTVRYREVVDEANEKLADARQELKEKTEETDEKLADAKRQIEDAEKKIEDGKRDIEKGRADLEKGRADLEQAKKDLAEGKTTLAEKEQELEDAKTTLAEKEQELEDARVTLAEKEQELEDAKVTLAENEQELTDAEKEVADKEQELADAQKKFDEQSLTARIELDDGWAEYEYGLEEYEEGEEELKEQQEILKEGWQEYKKQAPGVLSSLKQALKGLVSMGVPLDLTISEINNIKLETFDIDAYAPYLEMLPDGQGTVLAEGVYTMQMTYQQLTQGDEEIKEGKKTLNAAKKELVKGKKKLDKGEMQLKDGQRKIEEGEQQLADARQKITDGRQKVADAHQEMDDAELKIADAYRDIEDGQVKINDAHGDIEDGQKKIEDAKADIADGESRIPQAEIDIKKGETDIAEAQKKLDEGEADLAEAKIKYEDSSKEAREKIADANVKLDDAQKDIDDLKEPEWYVLDRTAIQTYGEYGSDAERIGAIGKVFPFIFFLVAALVSLTTMTRMVEEERLSIGTLKALGYGKWSIASKYIYYALGATLLGSVLGAAAGEKLLPYVIMTAYFILYQNLPVMVMPINLHYAFMAAGLALACTVLATISSSYKELLSTAAALMRPVPPKLGKRVLLEYVTPVWRRLKFIQKATVRNIFRYKKRCLMTVFGTGGCMALLLVGFGLHDSIYTLGDKQYNDIWTYDVLLRLDDDAEDIEQEKLDAYVDGGGRAGEITAHMKANQTILDVSVGDVTKEAYLFVPETTEGISRFVHLRNRTGGETYELDDGHVLVTEKLAGLLGVGIGDAIGLKEDEGTVYTVTVGGIAENYLHHYVYLTPALYEKVYGEMPEYNTMFLGTEQLDEALENQLGTDLLSFDAATMVTFIGTMRGQISDMLDSLNVVIWVLIISAGLLAFVVLYNLNNININERQRELATIKVLGFYDGELAAYVYRENILLTIIGSMAGVVMGYFLHRYVMTTVEVDMLMFGRQIRPASYLYSILLTNAFSAFVNLVMFWKLKRIDMVESLKSVE